MACLCAPTTHEGSFRCRFHRGTKSTNLVYTTERAIPKTLHHHHHDDHHSFLTATRVPPLAGDPRASSSSSVRIGIPAPGTPPPAKKCASLAMIKHFKQKQAGSPARHSHRNSGFPIGPSRLSRMAVACAEELPLLKEDHCTTTPCSGSIAGAGTAARKVRLREPVEDPGSASITAMQIKLKTRSTYTFKQIESSCRIVGGKEGSLMMSAVC